MNTPLTPPNPEDVDRLTQLFHRLSPAQRLWVSGFIAGFLAQPAAEESSNSNVASVTQAPLPITVLYGSQTGNAERLARQMVERLIDAGHSVQIESMAHYNPARIKREQWLLLVVSTHGEGDPPDNAISFHRFLISPKAPKLTHLRYAVLALGDSSYEQFCKTGIDMDQRLLSLGAEPLIDRLDCDVDYEEASKDWLTRLLQQLGSRLSGSTSAGLRPLAPLDAQTPRYSRHQPFKARLVENVPLTARQSSKDVRHIALSLADSDIRYSAGDALGVIPQNWPERVEGVLEALSLYHADPIQSAKGVSMSLESALLSEYEITTITRPFLEKWANLTQSQELSALLKPDQKASLKQWLNGREILDVIKRYPLRGLSAQQFVDLLRQISPRLYSIASSWHLDPDEVHLTVAVVRYEAHELARQGVASTFLSDRIGETATVPVYLHENPNFRLPVDGETPIIMIGPGTGVAPFRAFLQERDALGATGKNWLFFGDREFQHDFLYQAEWLEYRRRGLLNQLDVAFSRDGAEKVYVQHRIREKASVLYQWIEEGAHLYLCGDASQMAKDVHQALCEVLASQTGKPVEEAEQQLLQLQQAGRYQRDVY